MRISTKGRYALRILIDLAENERDEGSISVRQISSRQGISEKYLEGIISKLNRAKLVASNRGKYGGYRLNKRPSEYTVYEVLLATEESMYIVSCLGGKTCEREDYCSTVDFWTNFQNHVHNYLKSISLQDLIDKKYPRVTALD